MDLKQKTQQRVVIENIQPTINNGEFYVKNTINDSIIIAADILCDGHDFLRSSVSIKHETSKDWDQLEMFDSGNDFYQINYNLEKQGLVEFKIVAWVDYALNWLYGTRKKIYAKINVSAEFSELNVYLNEILKNVKGTIKKEVLNLITMSKEVNTNLKEIENWVLTENAEFLFLNYGVKHFKAESKSFYIYVDRKKATFSTWYEFFPRSSGNGVKHGTFKDCIALLPKIAKMGFDVLYFPPIHPIGEVNRKGKNNATNALKGDEGSCWAIGSKDGGHKAVHVKLGTITDFEKLVKAAKDLDIEIALDFALQAAPDHPWVKENPNWFKWRPDGSIQYAENPPKKYQDILPIYFETAEWNELWAEILSTAVFWINKGVSIFRVDNPHTKPFHFWGWLIQSIKTNYPNTLFLSEAFTRPKIMNRLAKEGFTQSYTYFTWRNNKAELIEYVNELTQTDLRYYFRPNFWPNTPDINPWELQSKNENIHTIRHVLAATLSSNYGIYGPVFEYAFGDAIPGKEEYFKSEKYEIKKYDWNYENKLTQLITKVNKVRKENEALQQTNKITFCEIGNEKLIAYYKWDSKADNHLLIIVNLDPYYKQEGWVQVPLYKLGLNEGDSFTVLDLITGSSYNWDKEWNFIEIDPALPYHIFKII